MLITTRPVYINALITLFDNTYTCLTVFSSYIKLLEQKGDRLDDDYNGINLTLSIFLLD